MNIQCVCGNRPLLLRIGSACHATTKCDVCKRSAALGGLEYADVSDEVLADQLESMLFQSATGGEYDKLPLDVKRSLDDWAKKRYWPGQCVTKILENDLQGAFAYADENIVAAMPVIVKYVFNKLPSGCHGSHEAMVDWANN